MADDLGLSSGRKSESPLWLMFPLSNFPPTNPHLLLGYKWLVAMLYSKLSPVLYWIFFLSHNSPTMVFLWQCVCKVTNQNGNRGSLVISVLKLWEICIFYTCLSFLKFSTINLLYFYSNKSLLIKLNGEKESHKYPMHYNNTLKLC